MHCVRRDVQPTGGASPPRPLAPAPQFASVVVLLLSRRPLTSGMGRTSCGTQCVGSDTAAASCRAARTWCCATRAWSTSRAAPGRRRWRPRVAGASSAPPPPPSYFFQDRRNSGTAAAPAVGAHTVSFCVLTPQATAVTAWARVAASLRRPQVNTCNRLTVVNHTSSGTGDDALG